MAQRITLAPGVLGRGKPRSPSCLPLGIHALTPRELDVMLGRRAGLAYKEIAPKLGISVWTVRTHARHAFEKLGVNSSLQAVGVLFGCGSNEHLQPASEGHERSER